VDPRLRRLTQRTLVLLVTPGRTEVGPTAAVADYEKEFGEISAEEIAKQRRADRQDASLVRGQPRQVTPKATSA